MEKRKLLLMCINLCISLGILNLLLPEASASTSFYTPKAKTKKIYFQRLFLFQKALLLKEPDC